MAKSGPAKKRRNLKLARAKKDAQKAAKKEAQFAKSLPQITEVIHCAFQSAVEDEVSTDCAEERSFGVSICPFWR